MFIYQTSIYSFVGSMTLDMYFKRLEPGLDFLDDENPYEDISNAVDFLMYAARHAPDWEGDIFSKELQLCVSILPNPDGACCEPLFMWYQHNNRTTYIASPFELSWMADCEVYRKVED